MPLKRAESLWDIAISWIVLNFQKHFTHFKVVGCNTLKIQLLVKGI